LLLVPGTPEALKAGNRVETQVERPIKVEFIDLPKLYNY
jgi:hypothetical protein